MPAASSKDRKYEKRHEICGIMTLLRHSGGAQGPQGLHVLGAQEDDCLQGAQQEADHAPARRAGQAQGPSGEEDVVKTDRYHAQWIQMAPGEKTRTIFYADDRTVWIVWGGQVRFHIKRARTLGCWTGLAQCWF